MTPDGKAVWFFPQVGGYRAGTKSECKQFDLETGKQKNSVLHTPRLQTHATFSPDGKLCAEFHMVWNSADGTVLHKLELKASSLYTTLAFTPDGKSLITGNHQHILSVFDLTTGKETRSFGTPDEKEGGIANPFGVASPSVSPAQAAVSPNGKYLATPGKGGSIRIWDLEKGTELRQYDFPKGFAVNLSVFTHSLMFTPDSGTLVAGAADNPGLMGQAAVFLWNVESGKLERSITGDPLIGSTVAISPDGKSLATMNGAGVIRFWDRETGKDLHSRAANFAALRSACFRPDSKTTIVTVDDDRAIREWDAAGGLQGREVAKAKEGPNKLLGNGKLLLGESAEKLWLQDTATGKIVLEAPRPKAAPSPADKKGTAGPAQQAPETEAALALDGKCLATADPQGRIDIYDIETAKVVRTILPGETEPKTAQRPARSRRRAVGFSSDGKSLVASRGDSVSVLDIATGTRRVSWCLEDNKVIEPADQILAVAISADGSAIAFDIYKSRRPGPKGGLPIGLNQLVILETATGKVIQQGSEFDNQNWQPHIIFSPDGTLMAEGSKDIIRVWNVTTGKEIRRFEGHRGRITSLTFSPDGKRLVSTGYDATALVWDVSK